MEVRTKINERTWSGHIVSWIKDAISRGKTIFQDATNDQGVKLETKVTKFPDILLFSDKISGVIFNGWELKFPDTAVDDSKMLENALEKAKTLRSDSFVTWNGSEAVIWKIPRGDYSSIQNLQRLRHYPKITGINSRADLEVWASYQKHAPALENRLLEILADLRMLLESGDIKEALSISDTFVEAIKDVSTIIIPQFHDEIKRLKETDKSFRNQFNRWMVYERATLDILATSSRKGVVLDEEGILAKFTFYNLIGKIIFYSTLAANLPGLKSFDIASQKDLKAELEKYFETAKAIDYQAVFQPYFTDVVSFSPRAEKAIFDLLEVFEKFDFRRLPTEVIGTVLENLVPSDEKQKFGQYFTPQQLATFVAFPAIKTSYDLVFDPTSGTGTFLNSAYEILKYLGNSSHGALLSQIWGNDISHFPAILSVINLYKQNPREVDNFPRVIRDDFFNLEVGRKVDFPDSKDITKKEELSIPNFDGIVSNFPFVQQEDIPDNEFKLFRQNFEKEQRIALNEKNFTLNERADYFTYCIYHACKFLSPGGVLSAITSNAWLGKEYGTQFKRFLLDNFTIKYVIKTEAEHWFKNSKVITIVSVLERGKSDNPTKFITLSKKLKDYFVANDTQGEIKEIERFYVDIDLCDDPKNKQWQCDSNFPGLYKRSDGSVKVSVVPRKQLEAALSVQTNWKMFFDSQNLFASFEKYWAKNINKIYKSARGERTGWNPMFIIPADEVKASGIEETFLRPLIKGSRELRGIDSQKHGYENYLFVCQEPIHEIQTKYPGAYKWIKKFENQLNSNESKTIAEACGETNRPFWYSMKPKMFNLITSIGPEERFFFTFSKSGFMVDQRLIALMVSPQYDSELIAALLNCTLTYLWIEMKGTARYEGVLDLNANDFRELKLLDPDLLDAKKVLEIKKAFALLSKRDVLAIGQEVKQTDRVAFDKVVFKAFGIDEKLIWVIYEILTREVKNRIEMKNR